MGNYSTKGFLIFVTCCDQLLELCIFLYFKSSKWHGFTYVGRHVWFNFHQLIIKLEKNMGNCSIRFFITCFGIL
jgi:hypothetical protein